MRSASQEVEDRDVEVRRKQNHVNRQARRAGDLVDGKRVRLGRMTWRRTRLLWAPRASVVSVRDQMPARHRSCGSSRWRHHADRPAMASVRGADHRGPCCGIAGDRPDGIRAGSVAT